MSCVNASNLCVQVIVIVDCTSLLHALLVILMEVVRVVAKYFLDTVTSRLRFLFVVLLLVREGENLGGTADCSRRR